MSFATFLQQSAQEPEAWRYTKLAPYAKTDFALAPAPKKTRLPQSLAPQRLVFVNGRYDAVLSTRKGLPDRFFVEEADGGYALSLEKQTCLALQPLELLFVNTATRTPWEGATKLRLVLGANSRLTVIERHLCRGAGLFAYMPHLTIELGEQAKLVHGKIIAAQAKALHFAQTDVRVAAGAFYDAYTLVKDGGLTRMQTDVHLEGELASTHLAGASLLRGEAQADTIVRVFHEAPHGTSRQIFKSVLDDKARAVFQGKIHVAAQAQKTDGHQLSRALLLSDKAEMDAKPELEIYADDVKCSHGSAIGDLNEEELFYLRSRGLPEKEARAMLIEAFVNEGLERLGAPELALIARREVEEWLKQN